jgi:hypothetical protein
MAGEAETEGSGSEVNPQRDKFYDVVKGWVQQGHSGSG